MTKIIDDKKDEAIFSHDIQLQLLKTTFILLRNQSGLIFNGRFSKTLSSLNETISKANKLLSGSELALFNQALDAQI